MSAPRHFSPYDAALWDSIAARRMALQACDNCGTMRYPPGPTCPSCLSFGFVWKPVRGRGHVLSWTTFHREYLPAWPAPHTVAAVQLEEGPIIIGYVHQEQSADLVVDAMVELAYEIHSDGYTINYFRQVA